LTRIIDLSEKKINEIYEKEMSLGERIFVFSDAGQRKIAKEDWQTIPIKDRKEGMTIYNELKQNGGIINLEDKKKISLIEKSHKAEIEKVENKGVSLEDIKANFEKLTREEQNEVLEKMDNLKATNLKATKEESFKRLPEDIQATLGISAGNLKKLTEDQRTTLIKKF